MSAPPLDGRSATAPASGPLFWRIVAVLPLLAGANLWTTHHLGIGLDNPGGLAMVVAGVGSAVRLLDRTLEKEQAAGLWRQLGDGVRGWLFRLTAPTVLVLAYLAAATFALAFSTVQVTPEAADAKALVTLAALDGEGVEEKKAPPNGPLLRFHVRTTPLGRPFRLTVDGYVPATVTVYPLVGLTMKPDRDLKRAPSVLLRLPVEAERALRGGGRLVVTRQGAGEVARIEEPAASFLLGRAQPIPPASIADWRLELEAIGAEPREIPKRVVAWKTPRVVAPRSSLEPDTVLRVEVRSGVGKLVAAADVPLGAGGLIDVALDLHTEGS